MSDAKARAKENLLAANAWLKHRHELASRPVVNLRSARVLVLVALVAKLLLVLWNGNVYDATPYDFHAHKARAAQAGLKVGKSAYNPALYYLPCLPYVEDYEKGKMKEGVTHRDLIAHLKHTNIPYLFIFYITWICFILPKLIKNWQPRTIAQLVLLCFPGFQKAGVQSHPDNLLLCLAALGVTYWVWLRAREPGTGWRDWAAVIGFGLVAGLVGWTRPFAAAPVAILWLAGAIAIAKKRRIFSFAFISRLVVMTALIGSISSAWYVYRWKKTGVLGAWHAKSWTARFDPYKAKMDRWHYFTSFYFWELLEEPNLKNPHMKYKGQPRIENAYYNSFPTFAYSEFWGDQWLYFSSSKWRTEQKHWPKRVLFVVALPLLPLMAWRFLANLFLLARRLAQRDKDADDQLISVLYVFAGCALYFYWLMGDALLPGAHTPIKFIYNQHIVVVFVLACFYGRMKRFRFNAWLIYVLAVFMVAMPVATFWPNKYPPRKAWQLPLYHLPD